MITVGAVNTTADSWYGPTAWAALVDDSAFTVACGDPLATVDFDQFPVPDHPDIQIRAFRVDGDFDWPHPDQTWTPETNGPTTQEAIPGSSNTPDGDYVLVVLTFNPGADAGTDVDTQAVIDSLTITCGEPPPQQPENPFTVARVALAQALNSDGYPAEAVVPEDLTVPRIVAQAGDPYIDDDDITLGDELNLHLDLWLLVDLVTNEQAATDLDAMLSHVLAHLPDGWGVDGVGRPGPVSTANWISHGMPVRVSRYITL